MLVGPIVNQNLCTLNNSAVGGEEVGAKSKDQLRLESVTVTKRNFGGSHT